MKKEKAMANNKNKQANTVPHTKIKYGTNTSEERTANTHAPRPVKDTQKPKSLPRTKKGK